MGKTSVRFFPKYLAVGQKSSKTAIALEGMPISTYPLRLFLLSLGLTYGQDITSENDFQVSDPSSLDHTKYTVFKFN
jgi:hypothetical protein